METKNENTWGSEECHVRKAERLKRKTVLVRADEEKQLTIARTKQQGEEEDTGIGPVGRESNGTKI